MENENEYRSKRKNKLVIGIGGLSRAGKSTMMTKLQDKIKFGNFFHLDSYLTEPIRKFDPVLNDYVFDWDDPKAYDLDKLVNDLKNAIDEKDGKYIIVEGFLLFSRNDLIDLLDVKVLLDVDKEVARERRKNTKYYTGDYYYDEYIWKAWFINKYLSYN